MSKLAHGFSLFMNWFDGILAPLCGAWLMLSDVPGFPLSWSAWLPLSVFDNFPLHDVFFTGYFWPGLALLLVNGVGNIVALTMRRRGDMDGWQKWCLISGILLIAWTVVEMVFMANGVSLFYLILGVAQTLAAAKVGRDLQACK